MSGCAIQRIGTFHVLEFGSAEEAFAIFVDEMVHETGVSLDGDCLYSRRDWEYTEGAPEVTGIFGKPSSHMVTNLTKWPREYAYLMTGSYTLANTLPTSPQVCCCLESTSPTHCCLHQSSVGRRNL